MESKKVHYRNEEWGTIFKQLAQAQIMGEVVGQSARQNNAKVQVMNNQGFNYKDRKKDDVNKTSDPVELGRRAMIYRLNTKMIERYREKLEKAIEIQDVYELERILKDITENKKNDKVELYHHLRLTVIKAQMCLQKYYLWR